MTHNHIIKQIRDALELNEATLLEIFQLSDPEVTPEDVADILKDEKEPGFVLCSDAGMELFLDGLITYKRGPSDTKRKAQAEAAMTNNTILKKLRIALDLKDDEMLALFDAVGITLSKSELTPFFRQEGKPNYKRCSDKMLKGFLKALAKN
jgi:uncharacterized protein YehS (DUF1456 family)